MCAIFGVLDYKGKLGAVQRLRMVKALGTAAEIRGTDATGIAFFQRDKLCIQKSPKPAHKMKYRIPADAHYIMGHTRFATQGNAKQNQNNHPFPGKAGKQAFSLAHNGVLTNDWELQFSENLPKTNIKTDSFVAVQLIEKQEELSFESIQTMAEKVRGSFTFTILEQDGLYFVKGENPLTIYHYTELGVYLYASTEQILENTLFSLKMEKAEYEAIDLEAGDILKIDNHGQQMLDSFQIDSPLIYWPPYDLFTPKQKRSKSHVTQQEYIQAMKSVAVSHGLEAEDIDTLVADGYTLDDIENIIYYEHY